MTNPIPLNIDQKQTSHVSSLCCENMIVIASGKGGVGKTMLSSNLCMVLSKEGKNILLFDGDIGLANIDIQLGLTPEKDLAHVMNGEMELKDAVVKYDDGGFDILAGRSGSGSLATLPFSKVTKLRQDLISMSGNYDKIIVDLGAGVDKSVRHLAGPAEKTYVIITDEPTSLTDGYAFIKLTRAGNPNANIRIIVNMANDHNNGQKTYETIKMACKRFINYTPKLAGIIRRDDKVRESIRNQTPLITRHPSSDAAQDIYALSKDIMAE